MSKKRNKRKGTAFLALGALLIAGALGLVLYNIWRDASAGGQAEEIREELLAELPELTASYNQRPDWERLTYESAGGEIPNYILNPGMDLPSATYRGYACVGLLRIPKLGLELPVAEEWSYPRLRVMPCRYTGSPYTHDIVIAAHNYDSHFGRIKTLAPGDSVEFIDLDGNVFSFTVDYLDVLSPYAVEEMVSGDWDLTLFTCTIGGESRVTVRCLDKARETDPSAFYTPPPETEAEPPEE